MGDNGGIRGLAWKLAQKLLAPGEKEGFVNSSWKGGEVKLTLPNGPSFLWHVGDWDETGKAIAYKGWSGWQQGLAAELAPALAKANVVVDVGSATGVFTLLTLAASPEARVIAVEPLPEMQAALQKSLAANAWGRRVQLLACAVADRDTPKVRFLVKQDLFASKLPQPSDVAGVARIAEVPLFKLDTLLAKERKIDFLKISAEGVEEPVLRGLQMTLKRTQPQMLLLGAWAGAATKMLAPQGYTVREVPGGIWASPKA